MLIHCGRGYSYDVVKGWAEHQVNVKGAERVLEPLTSGTLDKLTAELYYTRIAHQGCSTLPPACVNAYFEIALSCRL